MTRDEVVNLIARWQEAFARRDMQGFGEAYAEDAIYESPLFGEPVHGREAIVQSQASFVTAFPDARVTSEPPIVHGDRAAVISELTGTQVGSFMGLPATGRHVSVRLAFLLEVRDGVIVRDRRIYDFTGLLIQVGVLKARGRNLG